MTDYAYPLGIGQGTGIELEYMIVDRETGVVLPIADKLIEAQSGEIVSEIEVGDVAWSNELALHLIEFKTNGPVHRLDGVAARFQESVARANELLAPMGGRLMPTAMHPWMDPAIEFVRWPHEHGPIYETLDRIFDCSGHGWSNLQSCHVNLAFANDDEFGRLHAAIRVVLPLLPALAASSPVMDGKPTGMLDSRIDVYRTNARKVPSVSGRVIPEPVFTREGYEGKLLQSIYDDIEPFDPDGILRHEWLNARGAIARFDRGAIEIRLLDVQECPRADLAIAALVGQTVVALATEDLSSTEVQRAVATDPLVGILDATMRSAGDALIADPSVLTALGLPPEPLEARALWRSLLVRLGREGVDLHEHAEALGVLLDEGCLARRMMRRLGPEPEPDDLRALGSALCDCLAEGRMLSA